MVFVPSFHSHRPRADVGDQDALDVKDASWYEREAWRLDRRHG
jgi:hypothetical protein